MRKIATVLFCSLALLIFIGCENPNPGDARVMKPTKTVDIVWGEFGEQDTADDFRSDTEVTLEDADGTIWATAGRAQSIYDVSGSVSTESYFDEGSSAENSVQFTAEGADWGGIYIAFNSNELGTGIEVNLENFSAMKVAVKGTSLPGYVQLLLSDVSDLSTERNLMDFDSVTDGDWTVYTIPFAEITDVDFTKFSGIGFWHPHVGDSLGGTRFSGSFLIDIEFVLTADYQ
ncbi:MAG: hypothetical protein JXR86_05820 [Spirochaetales bacterium]|nr:hypothetical protein [Spirochaetales bacterium]